MWVLAHVVQDEYGSDFIISVLTWNTAGVTVGRPGRKWRTGPSVVVDVWLSLGCHLQPMSTFKANCVPEKISNRRKTESTSDGPSLGQTFFAMWEVGLLRYRTQISRSRLFWSTLRSRLFKAIIHWLLKCVAFAEPNKCWHSHSRPKLWTK